MQKHVKYILIIAAMVSLSGCFGAKKEAEVVARVGDKTLSINDIEHIYPEGCTSEDSATLRKMYVDKWVKTQLLVQTAEINLPTEQADVREEIEEYRNSLLIYKYEAQMLQNRLDTVVTRAEMEEMLNNEGEDFLLNEYAVRGIYIKLPLDAPQYEKAMRKTLSVKNNEVDEFEQYCMNYAEVYDDFEEDWVRFSAISRWLPDQEEGLKNLRGGATKIEQKDSLYLYVVKIFDRREPGKVAPLSVVEERLKNVIINKRKMDFITQLEEDIYKVGLEKEQVKIYTENNE